MIMGIGLSFFISGLILGAAFLKVPRSVAQISDKLNTRDYVRAE